MPDLDGRRILVVGASVSIGATIALEAGRQGAKVAVAARRKDKLDELVEQVGPTSLAIRCDVTVPEECQRVVDEAVAALGGLDWLVYTPAVFPLGELSDFDATAWRWMLDTNFTGAALVTRAALPHLVKSRGRVLYFISDSTYARPHWPGLAAYSISKVALDRLAECWKVEAPEVTFTVVEVGGTEGSEGPLNGGWTPEQIARFTPHWAASGRLSGYLQSRTTVAEHVLHALASPSYIERISVIAPRVAPPDAEPSRPVHMATAPDPTRDSLPQ